MQPAQHRSHCTFQEHAGRTVDNKWQLTRHVAMVPACDRRVILYAVLRPATQACAQLCLAGTHGCLPAALPACEGRRGGFGGSKSDERGGVILYVNVDKSFRIVCTVYHVEEMIDGPRRLETKNVPKRRLHSCGLVSPLSMTGSRSHKKSTCNNIHNSHPPLTGGSHNQCHHHRRLHNVYAHL